MKEQISHSVASTHVRLSQT